MALSLQHQTPAEFVARFREAYRASDRETCARLAAKLYDWYAAGDVTASQIKTAFGLSDAQWLVFRDKVQALRNHWVAVQEARGE